VVARSNRVAPTSIFNSYFLCLLPHPACYALKYAQDVEALVRMSPLLTRRQVEPAEPTRCHPGQEAVAEAEQRGAV